MNYLRIFSLFSLLLFNIYLIHAESSYSLVSVNVLFRHGDRTPTGKDGYEWYPNDPYANKSYKPLGLGALTNNGKFREFVLGKNLRKRYDDLLGDIYDPSYVKARSTDTSRTKMSTQLALAGLYPPKDGQVWNKELDWQPIPVIYSPSIMDPFFKWEDCPMFIEELARVKNSTEYKKDVSKFKKLLKDLTVITGKKLDNTKLVFHLYHLLVAQQSSKLKLPKWTKKYFPHGPMLDAALFEYQTQSYTTELRKYSGGFALSKVLRNMNLSMDEENPDAPKFFLYGIHESNLNAILISLNVWKSFVPQYSSAIIFELHKRESAYYVKLVYYKGIPTVFENMILPGCSEYCPLEKFIELNQVLLPESPTHAFETCYGPYFDSKLLPEDADPIEWMYEKFVSWFEI